MTNDELVARVNGLVERAGGRRVMVGITGTPGAGKSTLAQSVASGLRAVHGVDAVAYLPMDGYHLADVELARLGLSNRKGAANTYDAGGFISLLGRLRADDEEIVYAPTFERDLEQALAGAIPVFASARIIVTEGNYLLMDGIWAPVRPLLDEVWFAQPDEDVRMTRLVARHVEFGKSEEFAREWIAGNDALNAIEIDATRPRADLVVEIP